MTLTEVLVALVVVLILISATFRLGRYVTTRSQVQLTQSMLGVIETALEQYYSDVGAFPFYSPDSPDNRPNVYLEDDLEVHISDANFGVDVAVVSGNLDNELDGRDMPISGASSAGLYYFLDRHPNSRGMVGAISNMLITNRDANDTPLMIFIAGEQRDIAGEQRDLVRFVDPWGTSLWYRYADGWAFPQVISAGPDRVFGTDDDIKNNF